MNLYSLECLLQVSVRLDSLGSSGKPRPAPPLLTFLREEGGVKSGKGIK